MTKKQIRTNFREACFKRDGYRCAICGATNDLTAHHIENRNCMPHGGYVAENGITVCPDCHWKAEQFFITGVAVTNFAPEDLYRKINSSRDKAVRASEKLADVA